MIRVGLDGDSQMTAEMDLLDKKLASLTEQIFAEIGAPTELAGNERRSQVWNRNWIVRLCWNSVLGAWRKPVGP